MVPDILDTPDPAFLPNFTQGHLILPLDPVGQKLLKPSNTPQRLNDLSMTQLFVQNFHLLQGRKIKIKKSIPTYENKPVQSNSNEHRFNMCHTWSIYEMLHLPFVE